MLFQASIFLSTFFMGMMGGPHCISMCGAPCSVISAQGSRQIWQFHLGRILGYGILGGVAAYSVNNLAWLSNQTMSIHPLWTFFHGIIFIWGFVMLLYAKQPQCIDHMGESIWNVMQKLSKILRSNFLLGMLWAFMPCGLLYSALLVAALTLNILNGTISMMFFAAGTSISLIVSPIIWLKIKNGKLWLNETQGMRIAGLLLMIAASWAIWMDLIHPMKLWCQ
jgi:sulfite exporter TauE/SafE